MQGVSYRLPTPPALPSSMPRTHPWPGVWVKLPCQPKGVGAAKVPASCALSGGQPRRLGGCSGGQLESGREGGSDARSRMARTRGRAWIGTGWLLEVKGGWGHEATCTSWLSEAAVNTADAWTEKTRCRHAAEGHSAVTGGPAICAHVDGAGGQHAE